MSYMKRAIEEIQARGWPVNNESLKRLVDTIHKEQEQLVGDSVKAKKKKDDKDRKVPIDGKTS